MKRLIAIISLFLFFLMIPGIANTEDTTKRLKVIKVVNAQTIDASGSYTSAAISLAVDVGVYSLQYEVSGSGTAKFEYKLTNNYSDYIEPSTAVDIATGITATSGPGGDGKDIVSFSPLPAASIKIVVTETGATNTTTVSAWLATQ